MAMARFIWETRQPAFVLKNDPKELCILDQEEGETLGRIRFNKTRIKDVRIRKGMYIVVLRNRTNIYDLRLEELASVLTAPNEKAMIGMAIYDEPTCLVIALPHDSIGSILVMKH